VDNALAPLLTVVTRLAEGETGSSKPGDAGAAALRPVEARP